MKRRKSHVFAAILMVCYALLILLAYLPTLFPPHDALDGIFLILLTLPWSAVMVSILDVIGPNLMDNTTLVDVGLLICAAINSAIVYIGTYWIVRSAIGQNMEPKKTE